MKKIVLALLLLALISSPSALATAAANNPDVRLDAIASKIAGHPIRVYCEDDYAEWTRDALGYTYALADYGWLSPEKRDTVWVHPHICEGLHLLLNDPGNREVMWFANSIHVLVHESVHQRHGEFDNCFVSGPTDQACEGRTDCMAYSLDMGVAIDDFHFPTTVPVEVSKVVTKKVRKGKRLLRLKRKVTVVEQQRNPQLNYLETYFKWNHNGLPEAYLGPCGKV